jgi:hypothetical protein
MVSALTHITAEDIDEKISDDFYQQATIFRMCWREATLSAGN